MPPMRAIIRPIKIRRTAFLSLIICCLFCLSSTLPLTTSSVQADDELGRFSNPYFVDTIEDDGDEVDLVIFPGTPPDFEAPSVTLTKMSVPGTNILSSVPAFDWCYGCSATSAAMMFGYYDNMGYEDMYTGPTNDGDCPMTNSAWGSGECPLSATHQGYDGLEEKGHVDDYWSSLGSHDDPYYGNWSEHDYTSCTADFMGTNQYYNWQTSDGGTYFFFQGNGNPLYDYAGCEPSYRDGCHGMRLFAESCGYTVESNFSQYIMGFGSNPSNGFTFADFQNEIDAGRPVIIQVSGHSMLGFGYSEPDTVYIHNTWDRNDHTMTWGGSYHGMQHFGVSVLRLAEPEPPAPIIEEPVTGTESATNVEQCIATLNGILDDDGGESCQFRFQYGTNSGETYDFDTGWEDSVSSGENFSFHLSSLDAGTTYYYRAQARNSAGSSSGSEYSFTCLPEPTAPEAPTLFSAEALDCDRVELSWYIPDSADQVRIQRNQGSFPVDKDDGFTVYTGDATTFLNTNLLPDTNYYYCAWSYNENDDLYSVGCAEAEARTDPAITAPVAFTLPVTSVEHDSAIFNGLLQQDGGEDCQFRFQYDTDEGQPYNYSTAWDGSINSGDNFSTNITGLEANTTYYYRAEVRNSAGSSSSIELSFTSLPEPLPPEAPVSFSAVASGCQRIDLSWVIPDGADFTRIQRKQNSFPEDIDDGVTVYFGEGSACSNDELSPNTAYYFRAWSFNTENHLWSVDSSEAQAVTEASPNTPPDIPSIPSPENNSITSSFGLTLSWDCEDADPGDIVSYNVYLDTSNASTLISANQSASNYSPGQLLSNTTYYWKVVATDRSGECATSPIWQFTTEVEEPPALSYNISLIAGWNFISLPLVPESSAIENIITAENLASGDIANIIAIYSFGSGENNWIYWNGTSSSTLSTMVDGQGYWIFVEVDDVLRIYGSAGSNAEYQVQANWNMIGFTSITAKAHDNYLASICDYYSMVYGWDAATGSWFCPTINDHDGNLEPGYGYWIYMSAPGTVIQTQ